MQNMKNIKTFGLAIFASLIALPALAGETYVRNEWTNSVTKTDTDLHLNSTTNSVRREHYDSFANKEYYEGSKKVGVDYKLGDDRLADYGKGYSEHIGGSNLSGSFFEKNSETVRGNITSYSEATSKAHETSAGVR